jgi:hypothetical protein
VRKKKVSRNERKEERGQERIKERHNKWNKTLKNYLYFVKTWSHNLKEVRSKLLGDRDDGNLSGTVI